jgi:arylsulfatase
MAIFVEHVDVQAGKVIDELDRRGIRDNTIVIYALGGASGKNTIEVDTTIAEPDAPAEVVLQVDGEEVARTTVKRTVPAAFTASETLDVGVDLGSPVSLDYFDRRPFAFNGTIKEINVELQ